jgi:fatty-acyl-CoA synthase
VTPLETSYWPADTSEPVLDTTVGGVLREAARLAPDRVGLIAGLPNPADRRRWTYAQILDEAERCAYALLARFQPGERVAVWAHNLPQWFLLEFGAALAGVTLVTVNPAYRAAELAYVLKQSRAAGIFLVPEVRGNPLAQWLDQVRAELPELREVMLFPEWGAFLAAGTPTALPEVTPGDAAQIQYTSGTTGKPKGALLRHRGITNNARFVDQRLEVGPGEVWLNAMPLFHTGGCVLGVLGSVQAQATQVLVPGFEPRLVLDLIEAERVQTIGLVPTMLIAVLEQPDFAQRDLSSLRAIVSGGATVPAELVRKVEATTPARFNIVFGQTESSPVITQTHLDDTPEDKAETIGVALPQTEVQIVDPESGAVVPPGTLGELCTRGYLVMAGYFEMPEATAAAIDADGWLHTGDLATMDDRGYCRIEGRLKDMIIRGGENIYPREIEELLYTHPGVTDVAIVGVPDARWGEQVAAFVRAKEPAPTAEELEAFVAERLAHYKVPKYWVFVETFPLTASGKVQKFKLREDFVTSAATPAQPSQPVEQPASVAEAATAAANGTSDALAPVAPSEATPSTPVAATQAPATAEQNGKQASAELVGAAVGSGTNAGAKESRRRWPWFWRKA